LAGLHHTFRGQGFNLQRAWLRGYALLTAAFTQGLVRGHCKQARYKPVKVLVSPHFSRNGGIALAGNVIVGGLIGMGVDVASGAINDLTPNDLDLKLERDETSFAFDAQPYPAFPLRPTSPVLARTQSLAALPLDRESPPRADAVIDSRVVSIKVLADHTVEELREPS